MVCMNKALSYKLLGYFSIKTREGKKEEKKPTTFGPEAWGGEREKKKKAFSRRASTEVSHKKNIIAAVCPRDRPAYVAACLLYVQISVCGQLGLRQTSRPILCYAACAADPSL